MYVVSHLFSVDASLFSFELVTIHVRCELADAETQCASATDYPSCVLLVQYANVVSLAHTFGWGSRTLLTHPLNLDYPVRNTHIPSGPFTNSPATHTLNYTSLDHQRACGLSHRMRCCVETKICTHLYLTAVRLTWLRLFIRPAKFTSAHICILVLPLDLAISNWAFTCRGSGGDTNPPRPKL